MSRRPVWELATGWTVRSSKPDWGEILMTHPYWPRGPTIPLYKGYLVSFLRVKLPGHWVYLQRLLAPRSSMSIRAGADKFLARPTSRCRRTETIVSLERGVCSCAELQVFSCYRGWKEACQATRAISTTSRRELSSSFLPFKARRRRKFKPFWQKPITLPFICDFLSCN